MPLFAIAGGLIGGALASSIGFTFLTGWAIGSLIGQLFAPGQSQTVSGPRLENTGPSASNIIGNPIQIPYGTVRIPGSIIWSNKISEKANVDKQSSGGSIGGGSSTTTITYDYYLDFAVAICEGPIIGIKKIWVNNKLIHDPDGVVISEPWLRFDIYTGTETQLPDPTMERILGTGNVPAHRGLAYVVFKQFYLKEYGNRAPQQIEFEVVASGSVAGQVSTIITAPSYIWSAGTSFSTAQWGTKIPGEDKAIFSWVYTDQAFACIVDFTTPNGASKFLTCGSEVTNNGLDYNETTDRVRAAAQSVVGINREGDLISRYNTIGYIDAAYYNDDWVAIYNLEGDLLRNTFVGRHDSGSFLFNNYMGLVMDTYYITYDTEAAYDRWRLWGCGTTAYTKTYNVEATSAIYVGFDNLVTNYTMVNLKGPTIPGSYGPGNNLIDTTDGTRNLATWICQRDDAVLKDTDWLIYSFGLNDVYTEYDTDGITRLGDRIALSTYMYLNTTDVTLTSSCGNNGYDGIDNFQCVFEMLKVSGGDWLLATYLSSSSYYVMAMFKPDNQTVPSKYISSYPQTVSVSSWFTGGLGNILNQGYLDIENSTYYHHASNSTIFSFNYATETMQFKNHPALDANVTASLVPFGNNRWMCSVADTDPVQTVQVIDFNKVTAGATTLGNVITDIVDRTGLDTTSYLDVTDCSSIVVNGFSIRDRESARTSIDSVLVPYFVDPVVSDWKIKFVARGTDTTNLIEYNDLGCSEGQSYLEPYSITLPEENNLPKEIDFRYLGKDNNYLTSHQRASRSSIAVNAEDKKTINTFVVLQDSVAKEATVKLLSNSWANAKRVSIILPKKYAYLEPTDIIQFYTKTNILITARVLEIMNTFNTLEIGAEMEYPLAYYTANFDSFTAGFDTSDQQKIPLIGTMTVAVVDTFPLFDLYDIPNTFGSESYIYVGGSSYFSQWPGGTVYLSSDNATYNPGSALNIPCITGNIVSSTNLSIMPDNYKIIDTSNSFVVDFGRDPQLTSITKRQLLDGGVNLLHISNSQGGEIVGVQTVSASGNRYTFSNLLRGRYHTYDFIKYNPTNSTSQGTVVTVLDPNNIKQDNMPYGIYDNVYYYKGVTQGVDITKVTADSKTYRAVWNDSPPVAHLEVAVVSSDLVATWVATAKVSPAFPLWNPSTDTYLFRVEIYNKSGTLLRATDNISTNTYTYTAANMATDSVSITDTLTFRVYRKSLMKDYDTLYSEYIKAGTFKEAIVEVSTPQLLYLFDDLSTGELVDEMQSATNPNLILTTGSMSNTIRYPSVIKDKRLTGSLRFEGQRDPYFITSGTSAAAADQNFSFMFIFKVTKCASNDTANIFFTRNGSGLWGIHKYKWSCDTTTVSFEGDVNNSGFTAGNLGDDIHIVLTCEPSGQHEKIYLNGSLVEDNTAGSFVSSWNGELEFGDVTGTVNSTTDMVVEAFAYWNNVTLSAAQAAELYNAYLGVKK